MVLLSLHGANLILINSFVINCEFIRNSSDKQWQQTWQLSAVSERLGWCSLWIAFLNTNSSSDYVKTDAMANRQCSSTLLTKQTRLPTAVPLSEISPQSPLGFIMIVFEVVFRIWRVSLNFLAKKNYLLWKHCFVRKCSNNAWCFCRTKMPEKMLA